MNKETKAFSMADRLRQGDAAGRAEKQQEEDARMVVARQVIAEMTFAAPRPHVRVIEEDPEDVRRARIEKERLAHTQQLIAGQLKQNRHLYGMRKERRTLTYRSLMNVMSAVYRQAEINKDLQKVVAMLRDTLKQCLYGCDVNMGICPDSNAATMTFFGNRNEYLRSATRGESALFESLEQQDVVLQSALPPKKGELPSAMGITEGDSVLYVPLLGLHSDVGVIEIHGLYAGPGITDMSKAERPTRALSAMIAAHDYRYCMSYIHSRIHIHSYMHAHTHTDRHTCAYTYIHTHMHIQTDTRIITTLTNHPRLLQIQKQSQILA